MSQETYGIAVGYQTFKSKKPIFYRGVIRWRIDTDLFFDYKFAVK